MKIKWLGHSCFLITSNNGVRVLTDPFDDTVGYKLPAVEADIVTSSHDHFDHNHVFVVKGKFKVLNTPGKYNLNGIEITGVSTYHDEVNGAKRGKNVIFKYEIDGINVCHCGDLGHILSNEQVKEIGKVDILFIPVGGVFTLDAKEAQTVIGQLKPSITIPMHYKTKVLKFDVDSVDRFLKAVENYEMAGKQEIEIDRDNLSKPPKVLALDYK